MSVRGFAAVDKAKAGGAQARYPRGRPNGGSLVGQLHFGLKMLRFAAYPVSVSGTALAAGACSRNRGLAPVRSQEGGAVQLDGRCDPPLPEDSPCVIFH